ncbi:hypothetical protein CCY01nite_16760 [Chitinophaga cymbidii]|uniref:Uncharacterized protein n=2 Tax=Chitinophaga cymbidii TaxID=1096750 RepID=A0A512RI81_9BACT|nr:hypothetical protein CCY01nite_16760 [Chitinophaga cymbidii]
MRERLHEAIDLATDEKVIQQFHMTTLEISKSEYLTLEEVRELISDAEASAESGPSDEMLDELIAQARAAVEVMQKIRNARMAAK